MNSSLCAISGFTKSCSVHGIGEEKPTILYLLPVHRKYGARKLYNRDECPFCGGNPIKKNPYSDRIKSAKVSAVALSISGEGGIEIDPNPQKEEYYLCNGCNQKYVWADIDINLILQHLHGEENIPKLIKYYYPDGVTLTDLLTKYTTGIVRRHSDKLSWVSNLIVKRQLFICFNYQNKRTYGTFIRKEDEEYYYTMKTMGIPKI